MKSIFPFPLKTKSLEIEDKTTAALTEVFKNCLKQKIEKEEETIRLKVDTSLKKLFEKLVAANLENGKKSITVNNLQAELSSLKQKRKDDEKEAKNAADKISKDLNSKIEALTKKSIDEGQIIDTLKSKLKAETEKVKVCVKEAEEKQNAADKISKDLNSKIEALTKKSIDEGQIIDTLKSKLKAETEKVKVCVKEAEEKQNAAILNHKKLETNIHSLKSELKTEQEKVKACLKDTAEKETEIKSLEEKCKKKTELIDKEKWHVSNLNLDAEVRLKKWSKLNIQLEKEKKDRAQDIDDAKKKETKLKLSLETVKKEKQEKDEELSKANEKNAELTEAQAICLGDIETGQKEREKLEKEKENLRKKSQSLSDKLKSKITEKDKLKENIKECHERMISNQDIIRNQYRTLCQYGIANMGQYGLANYSFQLSDI